MKLNQNNNILMSGNRIVRLLLASLICLAMLLSPLSKAWASAEEVVDLDRIGSISVTIKFYNEQTGKSEAVGQGNTVALSKVADLVWDAETEQYKYALLPAFSEIELPDNNEDLDLQNPTIATECVKIAKSIGYDYGPVELSSDGSVTFSDLPVGLYMMCQVSNGGKDTYYTVSPFLVSVPFKNTDGSLTYDVVANSKPIGVVKHSPPPPPPPPVPQTGQLWWPVMVLGGVGALFVFFGFIRKIRNS